MNTKPIEEELRDISKEYLESMYIDEDMTQQQIAQELGCSRAYVGAILRGCGIPIRQGGKFNAQHRVSISNEIVRLHNDEHLTQEKIAKIVGYSQANVARIIRERGVQTRGSTGTITTQKMSSINTYKLQRRQDRVFIRDSVWITR